MSREIKRYKPLQQREQDKANNTRDFNGFLEDTKIKECWLVKQSRGSYCLVKHVRGYKEGTVKFSQNLREALNSENSSTKQRTTVICGSEKQWHSLQISKSQSLIKLPNKSEGRIKKFPDMQRLTKFFSCTGTYLRTYFNWSRE